MLSDDILGFNDSVLEKVSVPEWGAAGDKVYVRLMTGAQRDVWEAGIFLRKQQSEEFVFDNMRARLVAMCACDEKGEPIFRPDQVEALGRKSSVALKRIYEVARRLNKLGKEEVDELAKNSVSEPIGVSGSGSLSPSANQSPNVSAK